jgi:hypothetical protein
MGNKNVAIGTLAVKYCQCDRFHDRTSANHLNRKQSEELNRSRILIIIALLSVSVSTGPEC